MTDLDAIKIAAVIVFGISLLASQAIWTINIWSDWVSGWQTIVERILNFIVWFVIVFLTVKLIGQVPA